jgi:PTH2 family peptidyl-tRNA hydrolase
MGMKQIIVVNQALKLPKGKLAAQVAHAAVAAYLAARSEDQHSWLELGMPKVVLKCFSEDDLIKLRGKARELGVANSLIRDAGKTVVPAGTITCLGLGPDDEDVLTGLTGNLKLL